MCAGVQNVSRPMERCQAMSQCIPTMADVTATTAHQTYHGVVDSFRSVIDIPYYARVNAWSRSMSEANKTLIKRWFDEVWNQGRESTIDELLAATAVAHGLGDTDVDIHGPAEFKPFVRNLRGSFPDIRIDIEDSVAEGDKVMVRVRVDATPKGIGLGVSPTGRRVSIAGIVL